ncbi:MAG: four helix bundle protein [Bacteroidota bacterium]
MKKMHLVIPQLTTYEKLSVVFHINRTTPFTPTNIAKEALQDSQKDFNRFLQTSLGTGYVLETLLARFNICSFIKEEVSSKPLGLIGLGRKNIERFYEKTKSYKWIAEII